MNKFFISLLILIFISSNSFATVKVARWDNGTATQVCQPSDTNPSCGGSGATGTVTNVSVVNANGISGSVSNPTTTPAITLTPFLNTTGINWTSVKNMELQRAGINWSSLTQDLQRTAINWSSLNADIYASGINWTDLVNGKMFGNGLNWNDINALGKLNTGAVNWASINSIAKINSSGVNWNDINRVGPINKIGINWTDFPASGFAKWNGSSAPTADTNTYITGNQTITLSGDISGSGTTAITTTLPTVNSNVGTFQGITVNGKGLVTAASNQSYLTGNQTVTLTGPVTGSGATSIATTIGALQVSSANINWPNVNGLGPINTGGINWTDLVNGKMFGNGINWNDVNGLAKINTGAINWNSINSIAKMNSAGINWNDINGIGPINKTGINWANFPSSGIMKFGGSSAPAAAVAGDFPTLNQSTSGNAATATALAANGTNCSAGQYPLGVDASGNSETCTDYGSETKTFTNKDLTSGTNTFPTFNQNTTGSAAKWTTARNLAGNSVDGSANVAFANKFIVQGTSDAGLSSPQFLGALGTGILKNTTTTGVLSIAVAGDFPTLNQSTSGNAATATAFASTPTKCSAGNYPLGIDVSGNAQNCTSASGGGTVTSVTFTGDGIVDSSTPSTAVTTTGTVTATVLTQSANTIFAGPTSGSAANPSFRAQVLLDEPTESQFSTGEFIETNDGGI
jgi:hypothetical protein